MRTRYFFRQVIGPALFILIFTYFCYHLVQGDRGLLSWLRLKKIAGDAQLHLDKLTEEAYVLERKVKLLRSSSIDTDMLDERMRTILNFGYEDELIVKDQ